MKYAQAAYNGHLKTCMLLIGGSLHSVLPIVERESTTTPKHLPILTDITDVEREDTISSSEKQQLSIAKQMLRMCNDENENASNVAERRQHRTCSQFLSYLSQGGIDSIVATSCLSFTATATTVSLL